MLKVLLLVIYASCVLCQNQYAYNVYSNDIYETMRCPEYWYRNLESCYRFIKSPLRSYSDARKICQAYHADLVSINTMEEHAFLLKQLSQEDPMHRNWYVSAHRRGSGYWYNADDSQLNLDNAFLPENTDPYYNYDKDHLVYGYSEAILKWGFQTVRGDEPLQYICEATIDRLQEFVSDDRDFKYGLELNDEEEFLPRGPYFLKQPKTVIYDLTKTETRSMPRDVLDIYEVRLNCYAGGWPTPTYEWFKEDYENDRLVARKVDPLSNSRYTVSGGTLILSDPKQNEDRGSYHCKATNKFGTIISEKVELNFGFINEFNLKRSIETGELNWGKALYCDPPAHYPGVKYYWSRDYFPNLVEEDQRVFVSNDGYLYFSALETIDRGKYSCTVQSEVSSTGRNGPFFDLKVMPHTDYQTLKFPNNFPKVFPEAPIAGQEVRLECVAFGYPIPSYNWTKVNGNLPRGAEFLSYNRILKIPNVQIEDQGTYACRAFNNRVSINNTLILSIQAEPNFTIPLKDKFVDNRGNITWTCEAFGIPDVNYTWWKNGRQLIPGFLEPEDRDRYIIQDNVLSVRDANPERDNAMFQCQAQNQLKTRYSSAQLKVISLAPSFKKQPLEPDIFAAEQGNVTIVCNPEAAPKPKFTWRKDETIIGSGGHRRILENGNLIISPVSRDDSGRYTCTATNAYGSDSSQGQLYVLRMPRLELELPALTTAYVSRRQTFSCRAYADSTLDIGYVWLHNGMEMTADLRGRLSIQGGRLVIHNVTFTDAGEYTCMAKTAIGSVSTKSMLTVEGPPGPPGGVNVKIDRKTVTIAWTDGATHGRPITGYLISARTNWNRTWVNITESVHAEEIQRNVGRKEATIENNLTPWSMYEFRVAARNDLGIGEFSPPSPQHSTDSAKPYKAPNNVRGGGGKIGDLTIIWDPLKNDEQNANGIHYKIFWRLHGKEKEFASLSLEKYGNIGKHIVDIPKENFYTKYDVKVQAINAKGKGPESDIAVVYSAEDMPHTIPQQVSALAYNSTALNVSWLPVEQTRERIRGNLIGHRLKYWKQDTPEENAVYYLSRSTKPWALIVGLQPDTYYFVKVMVYNAAGEGPESERFLERTFRKAPQKPPSAVHIKMIDPSTIRVVWRYVSSSDEEPLIGYKIRVWETDLDVSTANDTLVSLGGKLEAFVKDLSPGKIYNLRVLAYSNGGDGRMSSPALTFQLGRPEQFRSSGSRIKTLPLQLSILYVLTVFCKKYF